MSADKYGHGIPDELIEDLARTILPYIRKYFESEEGQREFAEWKEQQMLQAEAKVIIPL